MTTSWAELLQRFSSPFLDTAVYWITNLGSEYFYTLALPILYWVWNKDRGYRLALVFLSSECLNRYLKFLFHIPRPSPSSTVRVIHPETGGGYAFPSGHAQASTVFWGWLSLQVRKRWFYLLAGVMVLLISISRIYLNVHWPSDVAGGIGIGLLMVAVWTLIFRLSDDKRMPTVLRIAGALVLPLLLYWIHHEEMEMLVGLLIGFPVGRILEERYVGWRENASRKANALKVLTGILGFLVLRYGLRAILPDLGAFHVLRYALIGIWVSFGGPWIFARMGWQD